MEDAMPQDEYFEWEDILFYRAPCEVTEVGKASHPPMTTTIEYRRTVTHPLENDSDPEEEDFQWSDAGSDQTTTTATSVQTLFTFKSWNAEKRDSPIDFPSYDLDVIDLGLGGLEKATPIIVEEVSFPEARATTGRNIDDIDAPETRRGDLITTETRDCSSIGFQPFGNVNYLLHPWREEDVSASWKHLVTKSRSWGDIAQLDHSSWKRHNNVARLENASWRTWSKLRFALKTVDPDIINWMKHCDDTCLYGPYQPGGTTTVISAAGSPSRDLRTPSSKSHVNIAKSALKKPSMTEILRRGSLPTFMTKQAPVQGRALCDSSPLSYWQSSHQHLEFNTPIPTSRSSYPKKNVRFLEEVRQYTIVNPIGDRKIHRTVKKTRSTSLQSEPYFLGPSPTQSPVTTPTPSLRSEPSHWSPDSLWSYNAEARTQSQSQQKITNDLKEWTWLGISDLSPSQSESVDYFSTKPLPIQHAPSSAATSTSERLSSTASTPMGAGSLAHYDLDMHFPTPAEVGVVVEDAIDYLLASPTSPPSQSHPPVGSYSPESQSSNSEAETSESSSDSGDDTPVARYSSTADIAEQKASMAIGMYAGEPMRGVGMGIGIGIVDDEKHALYEQIMEEFELGY